MFFLPFAVATGTQYARQVRTFFTEFKHRKARAAGLAAAKQRHADQQATMDALALARANAKTPEERNHIKRTQFMFMYGADMWELACADLMRPTSKPATCAAPYGAMLLDIETMALSNARSGRAKPSPSWESHFPTFDAEYALDKQLTELAQALQRRRKHARDTAVAKVVGAPRRDYGVNTNPDKWVVRSIHNPGVTNKVGGTAVGQGTHYYVEYTPTGERLTGYTKRLPLANEWLHGLATSNTRAVHGVYEINVFL